MKPEILLSFVTSSRVATLSFKVREDFIDPLEYVFKREP